MFQTGYKPLVTLSRLTDYIGGICAWWYTPVQNILTWPAINPLTQDYNAEPTLKDGATWHGPVRVPDSQLVFDEVEKTTAAGRYFEIELSGKHPGDERTSRANLQNMGYHRYVIVAKQRSGGFYLLIGSPQSPLKLLQKYTSDKGGNGTPATTFEFKTEMRHKSPSLSSFLGDNSLAPVVGDGGIVSPDSGAANDAETIFFAGVDEVIVSWNDARKARFGAFPEIEVWINDGPGQIYKENSSIKVDAQPPATTQFIIQLTGIASGWIVLK